MSGIEDIGLKNLSLEETGKGDSSQSVKRPPVVTSMATTISEVSDSIKRVGYKGPLLDGTEFSKALADGPKSVEFTKLVSFLTNEIRVLRSLDECVNPILTPEDSSTFIMESSSFLNELGCPYSWLTQGHVSDRFSTEQDKLLFLEYLSMETIMARIHREQNPGKKIELKLHESAHAADLRKILQTLNMSKPPPNISMKLFMQKLMPVVKDTVEKAGPELLGHPILNATLTPKKWETVHEAQQDLHSDFQKRREMLLKRLDCTIQSFQWSNKTKGKEDLINQVYTERRKQLKAEPDVDISDLLASRDDLAIIEKTSSASVRKNTKSAVNSVIIGHVPDRGGRASEQAPPPPEMPPWQQRNAGGGGGGFGGGRGGGSANYSRGGGQQSGFGRGGSFSQGGSNYSSTGRGSSSYFQSGNNYSSSGQTSKPYGRENSFTKSGGGFDSAGAYGRSDSGGYSNDNRRGSSDNYSSTSHGGGRDNFDSAGKYGGYSQEPKRPKTYDQYQPNKTTYADQYVQDSSRNQQYQPRGGGGGRGGGRSNYNRGGGSSYR